MGIWATKMWKLKLKLNSYWAAGIIWMHGGFNNQRFIFSTWDDDPFHAGNHQAEKAIDPDQQEIQNPWPRISLKILVSTGKVS